MSTVTKPIILDETGQRIATALETLALNGGGSGGSGGTTVVANPTLAGTEAELTGLQVGSTKYKVPQGGGATLYQHNIAFKKTTNIQEVFFQVVIMSMSSTQMDYQAVLNFMDAGTYGVSTFGEFGEDTNTYMVGNIYTLGAIGCKIGSTPNLNAIFYCSQGGAIKLYAGTVTQLGVQANSIQDLSTQDITITDTVVPILYEEN